MIQYLFIPRVLDTNAHELSKRLEAFGSSTSGSSFVAGGPLSLLPLYSLRLTDGSVHIHSRLVRTPMFTS
jgi:hypothetical protein